MPKMPDKKNRPWIPKRKKKVDYLNYNRSREDKLPKTSIDEELLYFANMLYATSKDDTKRVNSIVDGIHKLKQ